MPEYRVSESIVHIATDVVLVDTSVLVARFSPRESIGRKDYAEFYLDHLELPLLVPTVVIVEAWGMLVGSQKSYPAGLDLLTWLNSPGRATIVRPHRDDVLETQRLVESITDIDCVDAMILELAMDITQSCSLNPGAIIATFDPEDFVNLSRMHRVRLRIQDMRLS